MHGYLAIFWLLLGVVVMVWPLWDPEQTLLRIRGTNLSIGWLALLMGLYNALRWWSQRVYRRERRLEQEARQRREHIQRAAQPPTVDPGPNFDFGEPTARPERPGERPAEGR